MVPAFSLAGQTALVTGASRGIGRAIAETFAAAGARVIVSSRSQAACAEVAGAIGPQATAIACDISKPDEIARLTEQANRICGHIDILVLNAAVVSHFGPMAKLSDPALGSMLNANLASAVRLCQMIVPGMAARGRGAVVAIASTSGLVGERALGGYALTKAALMQLMRNIAVEYGKDGVRANAVAPGLVRTDMTRAIWSNPERLDAVLRTTALRRAADPSDIANAACFLASPAAACITGQVLVVDAGMTINLSTP